MLGIQLIKMNKLIGVYGTLRKGASNHKVLGNSIFIETIRITGFKMFGKKSFPAVIKGLETDEITIEIFRVNSLEVSNEIDLLEGFDRNNPMSKDNFYIIHKLKLDNYTEPIEIYTFDHHPERVHDLGPQLIGGDWCKRNND